MSTTAVQLPASTGIHQATPSSNSKMNSSVSVQSSSSSFQPVIKLDTEGFRELIQEMRL